MRICLYPYSEGSGIGTYIIELAHALKKTEHEIVVIGEAEELAKKNNIKFYKTPKTRFSLFGRVKQLPPFSYFDPLFFGKKLSALINGLNADIVHTADHLPCHSIKAPIVSVGWDFPKSPKGNWELAKKYSTIAMLPYRFVRETEMSIKDFFALRKTNVILGITHYVTDSLIKKGYNAIYFPPGITMQDKEYKKNDALTLTFVGRHHIWIKRKGLKYLLDALTIVKRKNESLQFDLQLIGEIPSGFNNVLEKYSTIKNNIKIIGLMPREKTMESIGKSHLLVAPSLYDEFGYVVLEAQSLGTAVLVSSHNPAFCELTNEKLRVDIFDANKFANALEAIIDKHVLIKLGKESKKFVTETYSWDKKVPELLKIYENILKNNKN